MEVEDGELNTEVEQVASSQPRRGRRIVSSIVGSLGTVAVILAVLGLFVSSFIGSSSAASSTVRSALESENVRRVIAEELVGKLEEGGDSGERVVIRAAHSTVVNAVEKSLGKQSLREVAGAAAETFYGVYLEGRPSTTVDIQIFADEAFNVVQLVDPSIPFGVSPKMNPIVVSRGRDDPDLASIRSQIMLVPWAMLVGGLVLLALSLSLSVANKWLWCRRLGTRIIAWGFMLLLAANIARRMDFGDDSGGHLVKALVTFVMSRLIQWSIVLTISGVVVTLFGAIMNRRSAHELGK